MLLSATVPAGSYPFLANGDPNPGSGYWVYAWDEIIDSIDRLRIMAYDYSYSSPGPIGPYPWAQKVTESAIAQVATATPANRRKIWLGVPQYSRNWLRQNANGSYVVKGDCPTGWTPTDSSMMSQSLERAREIAAREQVTPTWDATYGEYTFRYWIDTAGIAGGVAVTCRAEREVWFEDTRGAKLKAGIVRDQAIAGLAVWEFGFVLDGFYAQMRREIAPPLTLTAGFDSSVRAGKSTDVTGRVLRGGEPVANAKVRVVWVSSTGNVKELGTGATSARGRYSVTVSPTRSGTLRITAKSQGQAASVVKPIAVRR
ncbi:MAG: glycosyl hydrolase family 18 protein [Mycobacterium sp.]